jgi:LacI family transcriptional regulator
VLIGVEKHLDEKGYKLITSISNDSKEKESKSITQMGGGYVDGLIICVSKEAEIANKYDHINTLIGQGTPVVMFDRICEMIDCDKVIINDFEAAFNTTEYLIKNKGCKNIIMTSLIDALHHGKLRAEGFKAAMAKHDLNTENRIIVAEDAIQLNQKLISVFDKDRHIDGVFGVNELAVTQAMHIIRDLGLVKSTIEIAGFCNKIQSDFNPSLIVVNQNAEKIGMEAAKLILNRIANSSKNDFQTKTININLS